ncbi:MAG: DUF2079 domain-containing protein, partial [Bdellovibrionales bacterium]|nr:DUF2079 domain-containing protein [Bdellovibrionales bacterium]
ATIELGEVNTFAIVLLLFIGVDLYFKRSSAGLNLAESWLERLCGGKDPQRRALFMLVSFAGLCFVAHLFKHWILKTAALDATYVNQPLNYAFGDPILKCDLCLGATRFSEHLGVSLFLIAPVTQALKSEEFIILLQNALVFFGVGALCFWGTLRKKWNLLPFAILVILSHKTFKYFTVWDFKEDHLGFVSLCFALVSLYRKGYWSFIAFISIALASKEMTPFIVPFLSIPILLDARLRLSGQQKFKYVASILILSIIWAYIGLGILMPKFASPTGTGTGHFARLGIPGDTVSEIIVNLLTSPKVWWTIISEKLLKLSVPKYLFFLALPFIFSIKKSWTWWVAALPMIAINILSRFESQRSLRFHYEAFLLPFLIMGMLLWIQNWDWKKEKKRMALLLLVAFCVSDRWPAHFVWRYFPSLAEVQYVSFFNNIKNEPGEDYLAATGQMHGQTSHLMYLSEVHFGGMKLGDRDSNLSTFARKNKDEIRKKLRRFLLNLNDERQIAFLSTFNDDEVQQIRKSRDGLMVYLELKKPIGF